jgi:hypothetical protein
MDDKKKISVDEIFEEELTAKKPAKKDEKKTQKTEIDEIFEEFLPAPAEEPIKKKKKVSEELLEEYITPPPKIVEKEKVEKPKEKKPDEELADFLIHPPEEEKKAPPPPPKKPAPPPKEPPKVEVKKPAPPPRPVEPPPQPLKEKEIVVEKSSSLLPFITGFFAGGFFTVILIGILWFAGPLRNFSKNVVQGPSLKITLPSPPPPEKKVVEEPSNPPSPPPEEKPKEVAPSPPPQQKPVEVASPPPPSPKFILTISNIRSESDLKRVKDVLSRNGVGLKSEDKNEVSKEGYEVYLDATYTPAEEEAVKLKIDLLGVKCGKKGNQLSCGTYESIMKANEIRTMLSNAGFAAKLRAISLTDVSWTIVTLPVEGDKEAAIKSALKKFRITSQKIE